MAEDNKERRVKVTDTSATHRVGTKRAAIKPHKRTTEPNAKQIIDSYLASLNQKSLTQTYWGDTVTKNAQLLRTSFGLSAQDEPYLLLDPSGTGKQGMLLSSAGLNIADGRGNTGAVSWKDLPKCEISCQRGMLVIGQTGINTRDAQAMATLLQQLQTKFA